MRSIFLIFFLFLSSFASSQCLKADIIFLLDWSGSEDESGQYITDAAIDFTEELNLGPSSVKIGIIPFNSNPLLQWTVPLTHDKDILKNVLNNLGSTSPFGLTDYFSSLQLAQILFKEDKEVRGEDVMKILIFISDGKEYQEEYSQMQSSIMKSEGCSIWCIGIGEDIDENNRSHLIKISSGIEFYSEFDHNVFKEELMRLNICP